MTGAFVAPGLATVTSRSKKEPVAPSANEYVNSFTMTCRSKIAEKKPEFQPRYMMRLSPPRTGTSATNVPVAGSNVNGPAA